MKRQIVVNNRLDSSVPKKLNSADHSKLALIETLLKEMELSICLASSMESLQPILTQKLKSIQLILSL